MMNFLALLAATGLGFFLGTYLLYRWVIVRIQNPEHRNAFLQHWTSQGHPPLTFKAEGNECCVSCRQRIDAGALCVSLGLDLYEIVVALGHLPDNEKKRVWEAFPDDAVRTRLMNSLERYQARPNKPVPAPATPASTENT